MKYFHDEHFEKASVLRLQCKNSLIKLVNGRIFSLVEFAKVPAFFQSAVFKTTSRDTPKLIVFEVQSPLKL